jgi:hypothetical protein
MTGVPPILSERDQTILLDLAGVRLLTGKQLVRLHFAGLANEPTRGSSCRRAMRRLTTSGLVASLPRRVGGYRAGSAGLIYTLDSRGLRWVASQTAATSGRIRRPWAVGSMFVEHTLAVAELYVRLREAERAGGLALLDFDAEPASWHRTAVGLLKPDAYAAWTSSGWEEHRWIEVDRSTESLSTVRRKLLSYVDAANGGDLGPRGVFPLVVVTVGNERRYEQLHELVGRLPEPAARLITVEPYERVFATPVRAPP